MILTIFIQMDTMANKYRFRNSLISGLRMDVESAQTKELDRWNIEITSEIIGSHSGSGKSSTLVTSDGKATQVRKYGMSNYFGIGLDAKIVDNFESCRSSYPGLFCCRFSNNVIYGWFGVTNFMRNALRVKQIIKVTADGNEIELPASSQVILLNIRTSYA